MSKIVSIAGATPGLRIRHTQGSSLPVLAWALLDDGSVRPLYEGNPGQPALDVWFSDDVFEGYDIP
jgi:hypothetical protein